MAITTNNSMSVKAVRAGRVSFAIGVILMPESGDYHLDSISHAVTNDAKIARV
jgi:hypothetical protein